MLELPPDVEDQIREKAARHGKDVADFLRLILDQNPTLNDDTVKRLQPEDYPDEGKDWTEEDLEIDLAWVRSQRPTA